jgi:hypothetical protein
VIRARFNTTSSTDGSNDRDQDRHLMTPTPVSRRRLAHCLRRFSSGPAGARSNLELSSQTVQEPSLFNIDYNDRINPFRLVFFADHAPLANKRAFATFLAPLRKTEWVIYAKEPFGGPQAVLAYLSRYTHRVAISNRRLISADETGVTFKWKDYRIEGPDRYKTMTLPTHEFIRRFLIHVLPKGVHRIRHYGLFANSNRTANIARARKLLAVPARVTESEPDASSETDQPRMLPTPCPCCGGRMIIIETFARGSTPRHQPTGPMIAIRIDTS